MRVVGTFAAICAGVVLAFAAVAQDDAREAAGLFAPAIWDLELGAHAFELVADDYIDYACGTNGGPPSLPLTGWIDYAKCPIEEETGFYEVYFQYDDEDEYWAKATSQGVKIAIFQYTSAYEFPIIASALFDTRGFLVGIRAITDPRVPVDIRENGVSLGNFLRARYGDGWTCEDLPRLEGETEYQGSYEKRRCTQVDEDDQINVLIETRNYRKPGQFTVDPRTRRPTEGQFVSTTRYEFILLNAREGQPREAPTSAPGPTAKDLLALRAMDCPGCDLQGVNLKRANLRGANLEGANLAGANLHAAFLGGANLSNANLQGANLNRADVKRANLDGANMKTAMMFEARFDGASLVGADMTWANAGKVQFIQADLSNSMMFAMDLRGSRLNDATFVNAELSGSLLEDANFTRSDLTGAVILEAIMNRANLVNTNLTGADMRSTQLINANLRGANLTDANFSYTDLNLANMSGVTIDGALWVEAVLPGGFDPN